MHFWIFSYNRGVFLQNCVSSLESLAPTCTISVFDDNSTDPETQKILAAISQTHNVVKPSGEIANSKHGGLYGNMQKAFEMTADGELMCFVQDDMQMVRPFVDADEQFIRSYFDANRQAAFINPTFLKGCNRATDFSITRYDAKSKMIFVDRLSRSAGAFYSDALIADVTRLREKAWKFMSRESQNEQQARRHFSQMAYLRNPFVAYLPNVSAYRGKIRTWAMRRAELMTRSGFYSIRPMSDEESQKFTQRDEKILPYAEDFLTLNEGKQKTPWIYYPLQNKTFLKKINTLEIWWKRRFGSHQ